MEVPSFIKFAKTCAVLQCIPAYEVDHEASHREDGPKMNQLISKLLYTSSLQHLALETLFSNEWAIAFLSHTVTYLNYFTIFGG